MSTHPDLARLMAMLRTYDEMAGADEFDVHGHIEEVIDPDTLVSIGTERAKDVVMSRVPAPDSAEEMVALLEMISMLATAYVEGFTMGALFERQGGE